MVISLEAEKTFDKIQYLLMLKVLERTGIQSSYLNTAKTIYSKPVTNIKLNGEKLEEIPLKSGTTHLSIQYSNRSTSQTNHTAKIKK